MQEEQGGHGASPAISMLLGGPGALPGVPTSPIAIWSPFGPGRPGAADAVETQALPAMHAEQGAGRAMMPSGTSEVHPGDILATEVAAAPLRRSPFDFPAAPVDGTQEIDEADVLEGSWTAAPTARELPPLASLDDDRERALARVSALAGLAPASLDAPQAGIAHRGPSPWGHGLPSLVADDDEPEPERVPISLAPVAVGSSSAELLAPAERRSPALLVWLAAIVVASVLGASLAFFLAVRAPARTASAPPPEPSSPAKGAPTAVEPVVERAASPVASSASPASTSIAVDALPKPGLGGGMGLLTFAPSARRHRVYLDGRLLQSGAQPTRVPCGAHRVRIGSHGRTQRVEVPCGGDVEVAK